MNIKNAASKIMFKIFLWISIIGFVVLGSTVDVEAGGLKTYLYLVLGWFICVAIAALLYDYRIFTSRIFAIIQVIKVLHGYIHRIRTPKYIDLYEEVIIAGDLLAFYKMMLEVYDLRKKRGAE